MSNVKVILLEVASFSDKKRARLVASRASRSSSLVCGSCFVYTECSNLAVVQLNRRKAVDICGKVLHSQGSEFTHNDNLDYCLPEQEPEISYIRPRNWLPERSKIMSNQIMEHSTLEG
jgi:hypothetical protein